MLLLMSVALSHPSGRSLSHLALVHTYQVSIKSRGRGEVSFGYFVGYLVVEQRLTLGMWLGIFGCRVSRGTV